MANTDARVGVGVTGQTILGTWWSYPSTPALRLVGGTVDTILGTVGPAGIGLGTIGAKTFTGYPAGLGLRGVAPLLGLTQILTTPSAGLVLAVDLPVYVGPIWLYDTDCVDVVLTSTECD